jgi:HSP20 family protein
MALVKWNRGTPAFSDLFENFFNRDISDFLGEQKGTVPSVNVRETKDDFRLEVAAPGLKREDFNIKIDNNVMMVTGEKEEQSETNDEYYNRKEFNYSSFSRSFHLPDMVNTDNIQAKYNDGILEICIPKKEEAKTKAEKVIQIQ